MNKKLIMIVAPVLLLVLGGAAYFLVLKPAPAPVDEKALAKEPAGIYTIAEPFVVNLADLNERRFAKVGVALEYSELSASHFAADAAHGGGEGTGIADEPHIRDIIISTLQTHTAAELGTQKGREDVKHTIVNRINKNTELKIVHVFYTEFAVQ